MKDDRYSLDAFENEICATPDLDVGVVRPYGNRTGGLGQDDLRYVQRLAGRYTELGYSRSQVGSQGVDATLYALVQVWIALMTYSKKFG